MAEKEKRGVEARGRMEWTANLRQELKEKLRGGGYRDSLSQLNLQCSPANLSVDGDVTFHPLPPRPPQSKTRPRRGLSGRKRRQ